MKNILRTFVVFIFILLKQGVLGDSILEAQQQMLEQNYQTLKKLSLTNVEKELEELKNDPNLIQFIQRTFSQSKNRDEMIQIYGFLYFLAFLVIYFLALSLKDQIKTTLKMKLFRLINHILGDISIILFVSSMLLIINFYDGLSFLDEYMYIDSLCMGIALFSIIWLGMGIYNIVVTSTQANIWREYEKQIPNRKSIKNEYENLHLLVNQQRYFPNSQFEQMFTAQQFTQMRIKRDILEYFLIRQEFIAPSFQPTFSESFLREDFDFSNYLVRCLGELGKMVFKINGVSILVLMCLVGLRLSVQLFDTEDQYSFYVMTSIPLFIMLYLIMFCRKMMNNYRMLVHVVDNPVEIKFTEFEKNRDPMANFERLQKPNFLNNPINQKQPYNKHEDLFWLHRPELSYQFLHIPLFIQAAWIVDMLYEFYTPKIYLYYLLLSLSVGFTFISVFILIPALLYYVTITTNVIYQENMKAIK